MTNKKTTKPATPPVTLKSVQRYMADHEKENRIEFTTLTKREKDILAKTVKLSEEVGELSNDVLSHMSLQRKSKLDVFHKENMYQEFADIIISTINLANVLKVDLDRALRDKVEKIMTIYTKDR